MYDNDIVARLTNDGYTETTQSLTVFTGKIASINYEREQYSGKTSWLQGYLTDIENVESKDQRFFRKLNNLRMYNKSLSFTTTTDLKLQRNKAFTFIGRFERTFKNGNAFPFEGFKIDVVLKNDFNFENIKNFLTAGTVDKKLADKVIKLYKEANLSPVSALIDIKDAEKSEILSSLNEKQIKKIKHSLDDSDNHMSEQIVKSELSTLFEGTNSFPQRIYSRYGFDSFDVVKANPWELIFTIAYMTIPIADKIAEKLGFENIQNDTRRIQAIVRKAFHDAIDKTGHTYLPYDQLKGMYNHYLSDYISFEDLEESLNDKENDLFDFILQTELGYQPENLFNAEENIYEAIQSLTESTYDLDDAKIDNLILGLEIQETLKLQEKEDNASATFQFAEKQKDAIRKSLKTDFFILTGGPGTGKTTTLSSIIKAHQTLFHYPDNVVTFKQTIKPVLLLAPTGKAANRMSEQTKLEASTIHKQFRIVPNLGCSNIEYILDELSLMKTRLIVIDEASMLDTHVGGVVFEIVKTYNERYDDKIKLILLGDENQLPSISAGQILADLNKHFKDTDFTVHLNEVKRQKNGSNIPELADMIAKGQFPDAEWFIGKKDITFIQSNPRNVIQKLQSILKSKKEKTGTLNDLQILTPYVNPPKNGVDYGTTNLMNHYVQSIFNSPYYGIESKEELTPEEQELYSREQFQGHSNKGANLKIKRFVNHGDKDHTTGKFKEGRLFRAGDKVICNTNISSSVTNGSVGYITMIGTQNSNDVREWIITVDFNDSTVPIKSTDKIVQFTYNEWGNLSLGYAITIHKSQGSEYENIIMTLTRPTFDGDNFLNRNILYTGLTRSSKNVILMGDIETYKQAARNIRLNRETGLSVMLEENRLIDIIN